MIVMTERVQAGFAEAGRRSYVANFLPVMRREFPEFWVRFSNEQIEKILSEQCGYAVTFGIHSARGIYTLFSLRARLGSDFPQGEAHAWVREILQREGVAEAERLDAIEMQIWGAAP